MVISVNTRDRQQIKRYDAYVISNSTYYTLELPPPPPLPGTTSKNNWLSSASTAVLQRGHSL